MGFDFSVCEVEVRYDESIEPRPCTTVNCSQTYAWSPRNLRNPSENYQNRRICQHNIRCPDGQFMFYIVTNFQLPNEVSGVCVDFMFIKNFDQPDIERCGELADGEVISDTRATNLEVEFRSNADGVRTTGFRLDVICAAEELNNEPGCTEPIDFTGRKKRQGGGERLQLPVVSSG